MAITMYYLLWEVYLIVDKNVLKSLVERFKNKQFSLYTIIATILYCVFMMWWFMLCLVLIAKADLSLLSVIFAVILSHITYPIYKKVLRIR